MLGILAAMLMQAAQTGAPSQEHVVTRPKWLHTPSAEDIARAYPASAIRESLEGQVALNCAIDASGRFQDCRLADGFSIEPKRFAAAAISLSKLFKMAEIDGDGHQVSGGRLNLPIAFWLPVSAEVPAVHVRWTGARSLAVIDCRIRLDGQLDNCVPFHITPFSQEARAAALEAAKNVRVRDGLAVRVHVPIDLEPDS